MDNKIDAIDRAELLAAIAAAYHDPEYLPGIQKALEHINSLPTIDVADKGELKLEVGKLYRTRDGRKAFIAIIAPNPPHKSAHGCMEGATSTSSWYLDGRFADKEESRHDLIELWFDEVDEPCEPSLSEMVERELFGIHAINQPSIMIMELVGWLRPLLRRTPVFISEQNGVKLYRVVSNGRYVYFTTPCGDVSWSETRMVGKTATTENHQVNGVGCK